MEGRSHWRELLRLLVPHKALMVVMIAVLAVAGALPLIGPLLIASFIDEAESGASRNTLLTLAAIYVGVGVLRQVLSIAVAWTATDLA